MVNNFPEKNNEDEIIDIRKYINLLWHWKWIIILVTIVAGGVSFVVSTQLPPVYEAVARVLVNEAPSTRSTDYNSLILSQKLATTYAQIINSEPVLEKVISDLGLQISLKDLKEDVSVSLVRDTQLIDVSVESRDPVQAAKIANHITEIFSQQILDIQVERFSQSKNSLADQMEQVDAQITSIEDQINKTSKQTEKDSLAVDLAQLRTIYANLQQSYEEVRLSEAQTISSVVLIEPANPPDEPIRPKVLINTLLASMIGALLTVGIIIFRESLDETIKSPDEAARQLGIPVLGVISRQATLDSMPICLSQPRAPITEAYRTLRTNIRYSSVDRPIKTLMVTSAEPGDGKSTVASNLASVISQGGTKVALFDCDFRRPTIHKKFGLTNGSGLSQAFILSDDNWLNRCRQSELENLSIYTSGPTPPNPVELLASTRMQNMFLDVLMEVGTVVIDTPPVLTVADASVLAPSMDGVILVVNMGTTQLGVARQAIEQLQRVNARILGIVLNNFDAKNSKYGYQYRYYHSYDTNFEDDRRVGKKKHERKFDFMYRIFSVPD